MAKYTKKQAERGIRFWKKALCEAVAESEEDQAKEKEEKENAGKQEPTDQDSEETQSEITDTSADNADSEEDTEDVDVDVEDSEEDIEDTADDADETDDEDSEEDSDEDSEEADDDEVDDDEVDDDEADVEDSDEDSEEADDEEGDEIDETDWNNKVFEYLADIQNACVKIDGLGYDTVNIMNAVEEIRTQAINETDLSEAAPGSSRYAPNTVGAVCELLKKSDPYDTLIVRMNPGKEQCMIIDIGRRITMSGGTTYMDIARGTPALDEACGKTKKAVRKSCKK